MVIPVAHDYNCPWCWIALFQTKVLREDFGVQFDWKSFELMPEELPWGDPPARPSVESDRPKTPSRMDLAYVASGVPKPISDRPKKLRTHTCLEATEFVKANEGDVDGFVERLYRGYWEKGEQINDLEWLRMAAEGIVSSPDQMVEAVVAREFDDLIVKFDDDAYAAGVYNVPTFWIGGERYAEQPTQVLREAILALGSVAR